MPNEAIKVLAVVPDLNYGGGENRILNIARAIDRSRFAYVVATLYSPSAALAARSGSMASDFADAGIEVVDLGLPRPTHRSAIRPLQLIGTAGALAYSAVKLRRYLIAQNVDVVDAHLDGALLICVAAARASGVPVAVTLYQAEAMDHRGRWRMLRRASLRLANAVLTDSRSVANDLRTFTGGHLPATFVVPNGVRLPPPRRSRAEILSLLKVPDDGAVIVGQVGGLVPYKGHRTLLHAARRVLDERPATYFLLIGFPRVGSDYIRSLEQETHALGMAERVRIHPYPGSISDVWQVIDVHVHASELDSLPNAIIEGMSLAKPAVVTAVGGVPDLVDHERTALVVPPRDPSLLATALLRVLRDDTLARRLGAAAYARYLERCTPEVTVRRLEERFVAMHASRPSCGRPIRREMEHAAGG